MSAADRPWWATDDDAPGGADADPLEAHRAARRGADPDERPVGTEPGADDGSWWVPAAEAVTRLVRDLTAAAVASPPRGLLDDDPPPRDGDGHDGTGDRAADGSGEADGGGGTGGGHRIDACGVCPICVGLRALGDARPDLVGHLTEAARQLALAVRTVVDAAAPADEAADPAAPDDPRGMRPPADDLRRIDLDD